MQSHCPVNAVALPSRTPGSNGCKWVCFWSGQRTRVRFPNRELNWRRKADEVERPFRAPIRAKNLLDRPRRRGVQAGFSIEFARVRSSPQRFDSVLSIVVWCGVPSHHQFNAKTSNVLAFSFRQSAHRSRNSAFLTPQAEKTIPATQCTSARTGHDRFDHLNVGIDPLFDILGHYRLPANLRGRMSRVRPGIATPLPLRLSSGARQRRSA